MRGLGQVEHINYAIPAKAHTSMYLMHKFWARKPHNVVREYIEHYSKPNEIVLDPFCGSGVTAIEALKAGRKAIAIDLDPMATFITRMTTIPVDLKEFANAFKKIEKMVKKKIYDLHETKCPKCKKPAIVTHTIWQREENKEIPIEIRYTCPNCNVDKWKEPTKGDLDKLKEIEKLEIPSWYPDNELIWNTRINVYKGMRVSDLFSRRNLISLSILYQEIENLPDDIIKDLMKFTFTSALGQASKLVFVIEKRGRQKGVIRKRKEVGSWATRGYWIPPKHFEVNAWNCFEERFNKIYRGKKESNNEIKKCNEAKDFSSLLREDKNLLIKNCSVLDLSEVIPENSIDYIFSDPPYGDSVPYLELDLMWASWLKFKMNFDDEIIISDSPARKGKNFEYYHKMLCAAFEQIYRVLKPSKWMTITFHNTDVKIYTSILMAGLFAGFDPELIIYQSPARASAKALLHPYGSAVGDYYIRFRKPEIPEEWIVETEIDQERYERVVVEIAKRMIAERGEATPLTHLLTMYPELKKKGVLLGARLRIDDVLKKYEGKEFVLKEVKDKKGKVIGKTWWLKEPEKYLLHYIPLSERVERTVIDVLNRKIKVNYDDILRQLFIKFQNTLTPAQDIRSFLEIYAKRTPDGKWVLLPKVKQREKEHNEIVKMLAEIGVKASYRVYADISEWWERERKLPTRFPLVPEENQQRVKRIDCVWFTDKRIEYEFEVENTTGIEGAIIRGANIPNGEVKRFIVIPEERENLLLRVVNEPALRERVERDNWKFIFYDALKSFYNENKAKRKIDISEFEKLTKIPKLRIRKIEKQQTLSAYA